MTDFKKEGEIMADKIIQMDKKITKQHIMAQVKLDALHKDMLNDKKRK
tara:strand:+ start:491 stop:634 length:144 start_codon:yes stop_codon:yes gene_type:complete